LLGSVPEATAAWRASRSQNFDRSSVVGRRKI